MGYYIFSYAIDAQQVKATIGSNDNALLEAVRKSDNYQHYNSQDLGGAVSVAQALQQLIAGAELKKESAYNYWYALIAICDYLQKPVEPINEIKLGYETDTMNDILSEFNIPLSLEEILLNMAPFFGLPQPEDFPVWGLLTHAELVVIQQKLAPVQFTDAMYEEMEEDDEIVCESLLALKARIDNCVENGWDLVSFCH